MQSIRQYHKFRRAVQAQYERDKENATSRHNPQSIQGCTHSSSSNSSSSATAVDPPNALNYDPEKGYQPNSSRQSPSLLPSQANQSPRAEDTAPHRAEPEESDPEGTAQKHNIDLEHTHSQGTALGLTLTGINVRSRTAYEGRSERKVFVVGYEGDSDPLDPHNWHYGIRIWTTFLIAAIGFVVGVASSIDSSALSHAAKEFHVSEVVESLATGLYLIGFGSGALFAGPIGETVGRNPVYICTLAMYMVFVMGSALSPNIGAQLAFRFLAGFFGSTPLVAAGGSISDLWDPMQRVVAFPVFANGAFLGPIMGPVMGGYIAQYLDWRWCDWITLIMSGLVFVLVLFSQPETYPPILLKWKAQHLRAITGDDRYVAEAEIMGDTFFQRLLRALYRPFILTATEPIIILISLYLTVIYIVLFTFLDGYTYIFTEIHHTSEGVTGLCFLGIGIGLILASALVPVIYVRAGKELKKVKANGGERLPPEFRLWWAMLGGAAAIPISLFWMGWTSYSSISIWSPIMGSVVFGYGVLCVFISSYQYIIDSYEVYSASALAFVTLIRYVAAGGMTVVGIPFYKNIGVHWTLTVLGCIATLMVPVPYIFYIYGPTIRKRSRYAISI